MLPLVAFDANFSVCAFLDLATSVRLFLNEQINACVSELQNSKGINFNSPSF